MSFNYNPYRHIEVIKRTTDGPYILYCHACGADVAEYVHTVSVGELFRRIAVHIKESHKRTPEDFQGWSTL